MLMLCASRKPCWTYQSLQKTTSLCRRDARNTSQALRRFDLTMKVVDNVAGPCSLFLPLLQIGAAGRARCPSIGDCEDLMSLAAVCTDNRRTWISLSLTDQAAR